METCTTVNRNRYSYRQWVYGIYRNASYITRRKCEQLMAFLTPANIVYIGVQTMRAFIINTPVGLLYSMYYNYYLAQNATSFYGKVVHLGVNIVTMPVAYGALSLIRMGTTFGVLASVLFSFSMLTIASVIAAIIPGIKFLKAAEEVEEDFVIVEYLDADDKERVYEYEALE
uniref:MFS domain-containing protein n=1 Tax=Rhabditophanes sp. KR3021 TaxID=114890 RepID=A0AC35UAP8_9BILA